MATVLPFFDEPSPSLLDEVRSCLSCGGVIAVPTESFYALAASISHSQAVSRIAEIKNRGQVKPLLVLIGGRSQLSLLVSSIPPVADRLMRQWWPGPLTLVFPALPSLPPEVLGDQSGVTGDSSTVAVRQPGHEHLCALLRVVGPVTGTSANRTGDPPPRTVGEVQDTLGADIDLILDGGPTPGGAPSTLVTVVNTPAIIREGAVPRAEVQRALESAGFTLR